MDRQLPTVLLMHSTAVLGTGQMGAAIAQRLLAVGHAVTVWNRTSARAGPLLRAGALPADTPAGAAAGADVVISMLTDAAAVDAVLFGPGGAAAAIKAGGCLVQMSTIGPAAVRALAERLPDDVDLVDAPVAGSVGAARAGSLTVLAAGADTVLDRVTPALRALGQVRNCGPVGAGSALKLVLNTALVTSLAALADALRVADAVGVDRADALEALTAGPLGGAVARATTAGASFSIALAGKDMRLASAELADRSAPVVHAAAQLLASAPDQDADLAAIV
jgi:3-hydroxyisobutyrate dehydrogenase